MCLCSPGFCVFCYQSIYICPKAVNSSESVTKFTKLICRLTGQNVFGKLLKGDNECETSSELKLQCCNECNIIIDGFCNYYHQFKVVELQMNWKLEQIAGIINHCNRVPSRWKTMIASLEETFPDDMEIRLKSQALVSKYRQAIAETYRQMYSKNQPCVLLKTNLDITQDSNTTSQLCFNSYNGGVEDADNAVTNNDLSSISVDFPIEEEMSNDDEYFTAKNLEIGQSTPLAGSSTQVKIEASTVLPVSDDVQNEMQIDQQDNPNTSNLVYAETNVEILTPSEYPQVYNLRKKGNAKAVIMDDTNSDNDSDAEFSPELNSERFSSESDDDGSKNEDDELSQKSSPRKQLKSNSDKVKLRKTQSFQCPKCNKSFGLAYHCRKHIKSKCCSKKIKLDDDDDITVPLDLKCGECDFIFMTKEQYWLHQSEDHEHILCTMCGRGFKARHVLKKHNCRRHFPTYPAMNEQLNVVHASTIVNPVQNFVRNKNSKPDKIHVKSEHRFRCKCLKWFENPEVFKNHENSHIERELQCKFCPHLATNVLKLSSHEYQNHCPDKKKEQDQQSNKANISFCWSCPRCDYKSTGIVDYQLHFAQAHFNLKPDPNPDKTCSKCVKTFVNRTDFLDHVESHKDKKDWKWQCDECGRKFTTNKLLGRHILWHNDGFKWECAQCGKKCITKSKLEIHVKSHSNTNRNIRRGKDTEGIEALEKLGFNTRSNKCEICDRVLFNFSKKCVHMKECHDLPGITDKSKCLNCDVDGCTAYFLTKNQLHFHRIRKHEDKNVDKLETFGFSSKRKECEICDRVLRNFSRKCKHMKECHGLPGIEDKSKYMYCGVDGCAVYFMTGVQLLHHRVAKHGYKFGKGGRSSKIKRRQRVKLNN